MKKIFLLLILIVCFLTSYQAKQNQRSRQITKSKPSHKENSHKDPDKIVKQKEKQRTNKKKNKNKKFALQIQSHEHEYLHYNQPSFWWHTLLAIFLSCAGGFFSGMTVGLNSLDKLQLQVQQVTGNEQQKKAASKILKTIKDHHLFLVTLLIGNAIVLQWLPLVVHKIMPDWAAILTSTVVVVIVAQIVPMSYTTGPNKYQIAYIGSPFVDFCTKLFYIIAYPMARGLDALLGILDSSKIQRRDFLAFVNNKKKNYLQSLEITMFNQLFVGPNATTVKSIMTSLDSVFFLSEDQEIDEYLLKHLQQNQLQIVFIVPSQVLKEGKIDLSKPVKIKSLLLYYLKKKSKQKANKKLRLCDIFQEDNDIYGNKKHHQRKIIKNNVQIPIIYSDAGLLDTNLIMRQKSSYFAFIHQDQRLKQGTNIAFLDTRDFQVGNILCDAKGPEQIIGIVTLNEIHKAIADFRGDLASVISTVKGSQQTPQAPKKRKLVKRASITSAYSSYSLQD